MKFFSLFLVFFLVGCEGSKTYRGTWNATSADSSKLKFNFDAKKMSIEESGHKVESLSYTQNSVSIENSVSTYGIQVSDGRNYLIRFPNSKNEKVGLIMDENNNVIYTICRDSFLFYNEIYKLH